MYEINISSKFSQVRVISLCWIMIIVEIMIIFDIE